MRTAPHIGGREIMGINGGASRRKASREQGEYDDLPDDIEVLQDTLREAKMQLEGVTGARSAAGDLEIKKDPRRTGATQRGEGGDGIRQPRWKLCEVLPAVGKGQEQLREYARAPGGWRRDRGARGRLARP